MRLHGRRPPLASSSLVLAGLLFAGTLSMFWIGYRATVERDRSTQQVVQSRAREVLALLSAAIDQDLKAGQLDLLLPLNGAILDQSSLYDLADRFAGGLARYPYIESVFVWRAGGGTDDELVFFNRLERRPHWDEASLEGDWYPVVVRSRPVPPAALVASTRLPADSRRPFVVRDGAIAGTPYQVVALRIFSERGALRAVVGLTVNLQWVRANYFGPLISQIQQVGGDALTRLEVRDERGQVVAAVGPARSEHPLSPRVFPLVFAQASTLGGASPAPPAMWSASVDVAADATASRGARGTLPLLAGAVGATIVALVLAVRSARVAADLAERQSDFVSSVSHEMKTPLSLITLASDSLASGRCASPDGAREYGLLLSREARHLSMLIDNVLCYARLIDQDDTRSAEPLDVAELIGESIERFRVQCAEVGCDVHVESTLSHELVLGDRRMLRDAFDNIIDNAIKYGGPEGRITVALSLDAARIRIDVSDRGPGIPADELPLVFEKFRRGRSVTSDQRGSGLGLTIARRVIESHRGTIRVTSQAGHGTTVRMDVPVYGASAA